MEAWAKVASNSPTSTKVAKKRHTTNVARAHPKLSIAEPPPPVSVGIYVSVCVYLSEIAPAKALVDKRLLWKKTSDWTYNAYSIVTAVLVCCLSYLQHHLII